MNASLQITKRSILRLGLKKFSRSFVLGIEEVRVRLMLELELEKIN